MKIRVMGMGCIRCKQLYATVKRAVDELGIVAQIEYIDDATTIVTSGILETPALVVEDKVVASGILPSLSKTKELISGNL